MTRSIAIGTLTACLALAAAGCSRSPRVTFYTLEPVARLEAAAGEPAAGSPAGTAAAGTGVAGTGGKTAGSAGPGAGGAAGPGAACAAGAPTTAAGAPAPGTPSALSVGPVTLPELVDRPQLVVRVAANRVDILESQRWAEPLKDEIPRVIAEDLRRLLGSSRVSSYLQNAAGEAQCRLLLDIERFEASPGEGVSVEAAWTLRRAAGAVFRTGGSRRGARGTTPWWRPTAGRCSP